MVALIAATLILPLYQRLLLVLRPSRSVPRHAVATVINGAAIVICLLVLSGTGITPAEAGMSLGPRALGRGVAWGAPIATVVVLASWGGLQIPAVREHMADARLKGLTRRQVVLKVPLVIVGTAAFEEILFRGLLLLLWDRAASFPVAVAASSIAFGLWHIAPALDRVRHKEPGASGRGRASAIVGTVAFTMAAGVLLALLRRWTGGIGAGIIVHAAANTSGLLAARLSSEEADRQTPVWANPLLDEDVSAPS